MDKSANSECTEPGGSSALRSVERGLWSLLLGVAGGTFEAEEGLVCFLRLYQPEIEGAVDVTNVLPWFDAMAHLKHPRGSQTTSIMVALGTVVAVENTLPTPSNSAQEATAVAGDDKVVPSQEAQEISQGRTAEMKWVETTNLSHEDRPSRVQLPAQRLSEAEVDEQEDISVKEKPAKKKRKKTKKKSKEIVIDDDESETDLKPVGASGSNLFKRHKPPPFRLSKR